MRMLVVVVLKPPRKLPQNQLCNRTIMNVHKIPRESFDERLGHAVGLWRSYRCEALQELTDWANETVP